MANSLWGHADPRYGPYDMAHIKWLGSQVSEFQNIFFRTGLKLLEKNVFHAAKETTVTRR